MEIAIIGSGNVGSALGFGWLKAGHHVVFGVRNPTSSKSQKVLELLPNAVLLTVQEACAQGRVIVITTPPESIIELIPLLGDVSDKIIIDATNSVRTRPEPFPTAFHALKELAKAELVVKCFNSTGYENMLNPKYGEEGIDMFVAGNSDSAKQTATELALDLGFASCYNFGGDDKVELLEKFALSWINLAILQGHGRNLAFKLIRR